MVIETTSKKTRRKDTVDKPELYARLGVQEYFLFDPTQDYLEPPLQGHWLVGDRYVRIEPDSGGGLESYELELGLRLVMVEDRLRFHRLDSLARSPFLNHQGDGAYHHRAGRQLPWSA